MNRQYVVIEGINGSSTDAVVLTPSFTGALAVVDLNTIKRLASMLPKASLDDIRAELIRNLRLCHTLEEHVDVIERELAFHRTINMITEYEIPVMEEARPVQV